jgi:hypothetical protein
MIADGDTTAHGWHLVYRRHRRSIVTHAPRAQCAVVIPAQCHDCPEKLQNLPARFISPQRHPGASRDPLSGRARRNMDAGLRRHDRM